MIWKQLPPPEFFEKSPEGCQIYGKVDSYKCTDCETLKEN